MINGDYTTTTYHGDPGHEQFKGYLNSYPIQSRGQRSQSARQTSNADYSLGFPYAGNSQQNTKKGSFITRIRTDGDEYRRDSESTSDGSMRNGTHTQRLHVNGMQTMPSKGSYGSRPNEYSQTHQNGYHTKMVNGSGVRGVNGSDYLSDDYDSDDEDFLNAVNDINSWGNDDASFESSGSSTAQHKPMYGRNGVITQRKSSKSTRQGRYDKNRQDSRRGNQNGSTHQREVRTVRKSIPVTQSHSSSRAQKSNVYKDIPMTSLKAQNSYDEIDNGHHETEVRRTSVIRQTGSRPSTGERQSRSRTNSRHMQPRQTYESDRYSRNLPRRSKSESRIIHEPIVSSRSSSHYRSKTPERSTSALGEHAFDNVDYKMSRPSSGVRENTEPFLGDRKFLRKVQHELEEQRAEWKNEVDRIGGLSNGGVKVMSSNTGQTKGQHSYVDESSGAPVFKAFVDIRDYPPRSISVTVDKLENKIVVKASRPGAPGQPDRTFTQKVQLPKFSDDRHVTSGLNNEGLLVIQVPLIYYFPPEQKSAKAFINEVKTRRDGTKVLEILVNVGANFKLWELKCQLVNESELVITGERGSDPAARDKKLIKRYYLPANADKDQISTRYGDDGRLVVIVPLKHGSGLLNGH